METEGQEMSLTTIILYKIAFYLPILGIFSLAAPILWGKEMANFIRWVFRIKK